MPKKPATTAVTETPDAPEPQPIPQLPVMNDPRAVADYPTYAAAHQALTSLINDGLEPGQVAIVGLDLKTPKAVRMQWSRVIYTGVLSGLMWGLLLSVLMWIFLPGYSLWVLVACGLGFGVIYGVLANVVQNLMSRGVPGAPTGNKVPGHFEIQAEAAVVDRARRILGMAGAMSAGPGIVEAGTGPLGRPRRAAAAEPSPWADDADDHTAVISSQPLVGGPVGAPMISQSVGQLGMGAPVPPVSGSQPTVARSPFAVDAMTDTTGTIPRGFEDSGMLPRPFEDSGVMPRGFEDSGMMPRAYEDSGVMPRGFEDSGALHPYEGPPSVHYYDQLMQPALAPGQVPPAPTPVPIALPSGPGQPTAQQPMIGLSH